MRRTSWLEWLLPAAGVLAVELLVLAAVAGILWAAVEALPR